MSIVTFIIVLLVIGAGALLWAYKEGKLTDADGDYIPDEVEEKVADVKKEVKRRVKRVKEEIAEHGRLRDECSRSRQQRQTTQKEEEEQEEDESIVVLR